MKVHQAGFPCVVGLMSSSLSEEQEKLLAEYFREAALSLDGDEAGRAATPGIAVHLALRMFVRAVDLSTGAHRIGSPREKSRQSPARCKSSTCVSLFPQQGGSHGTAHRRVAEVSSAPLLAGRNKGHTKFFTPDSSWTWYVTEGAEQEGDFIFYHAQFGG